MDTQAFAAHATRYAAHVFCRKCAHTCTVAAKYLRMDRQVSEWSRGCECQASDPSQFVVQHLACARFRRAWLRASGQANWAYWRVRNARRDDPWTIWLTTHPEICSCRMSGRCPDIDLTLTWQRRDIDYCHREISKNAAQNYEKNKLWSNIFVHLCFIHSFLHDSSLLC